jgi:GTP:adenosylcobinamide-phosphate guanylyltransferase
MDAIVTAGGIPQPGEPLYPYTQGKSKALLDINGKPMIQWVLDALSGADRIERVILIGLDASSEVTCAKPLTYLPNYGSMLENIRNGILKAVELNPATEHVLLVSSDIPGITSEMVNWAIDAAMQTNDDLYYNLIKREVMEARYPGSKRTFTRLKDAEVCGGDMNVVHTSTVTKNAEIWERLIGSRKNALKQAAILGFDTLFLLAFRLITVEGAVKKVSQQLKLRGRAILCPYAEVGMDVDKPHQLELMRADLARRAEGRTEAALPGG